MNTRILPRHDVAYLDKQLLDEVGNLRILDSTFYSTIPIEHLTVWCHNKGIYCLPTVELIEWLRLHVILGETIEIGSGNGAIGRELNIPITDACLMRKSEIVMYYTLIGQPVTNYPDDIIEFDAVKAIDFYKPSVVIGSWITHRYQEEQCHRGGNAYGVDENFVIENVNKYIMIGNESVHKLKPILELSHKEYKFPWLYSRSLSYENNVIYVWEKV
jgi:hypothetical protein